MNDSTPTSPAKLQTASPITGARQFTEALVCLAIAVLLFRTFQAEGYMISTGSMAPCLLGYHKRITCPSCSFSFAVGVSEEDADGELKSSWQLANWDNVPARCPNCGQTSIDVTKVPRNEGDQLLVHRAAYLFRKPRRWEIVVFRNPGKPTQAFVKRAVGLPNETIHIVDGDVYADGVLQRKDLDLQRTMRISVYDHDHSPPNIPGWQNRWVIDDQTPGWKPQGHGFVFDDPASGRSDRRPWSWIRYQHWIRSGGNHFTAVPLDYWFSATNPEYILSPVQYRPATKELCCYGALTNDVYERLKGLSGDPQFLKALDRLYAESHISPVTDTYGYNRPPRVGPSTPVRDLTFAARVRVLDGDGVFCFRMTDGKHVFRCDFDIEARTASLNVDHSLHAARMARLPDSVFSRPIQIEMSIADQQVLVGIDGQTIFSPWTYSLKGEECYPRKWPVEIGARGLKIDVDSLKLYRDVYYTNDQFPDGVNTPYQLGSDEFYVLGDNSPVSRDSRSWPHPAVPFDLFLGRPFVVHLPSHREKVDINGKDYYIRIPDFSRMRYIR